MRHGFKCYGRTLRVAFFKAAHGLNPELETRFAANRLGLTRQLHFSPKNEKSLDSRPQYCLCNRFREAMVVFDLEQSHMVR